MVAVEAYVDSVMGRCFSNLFYVTCVQPQEVARDYSITVDYDLKQVLIILRHSVTAGHEDSSTGHVLRD